MNHPSSTNLANILRSILSLVDYYGDTYKHGPALRDLKLSITRVILDLEAETSDKSPDELEHWDGFSDVQHNWFKHS